MLKILQARLQQYVNRELPDVQAICKASPDSHFAFLHFFSMGMVLIPISCIMSGTSVHSSLGILSIRSSSLNLFLTSTVYTFLFKHLPVDLII